jgi:hypothetical protein
MVPAFVTLNIIFEYHFADRYCLGQFNGEFCKFHLDDGNGGVASHSKTYNMKQSAHEHCDQKATPDTPLSQPVRIRPTVE